MVIVGLLLLGLAIAAGVDVAAQNHGQSLHIHAAGQTFTTTPAALVVVGSVCAFVAVVGILLIHDGSARRRRLARDARLVRAHRDDLASQGDANRNARLEAEREEAPVAPEDDLAAVSGRGGGDLVDLRDGAPATTRRTGWLHRTH